MGKMRRNKKLAHRGAYLRGLLTREDEPHDGKAPPFDPEFHKPQVDTNGK